MKAVQLVRPGSPVELREVEVREPQADEVMVRVRAAGICHSDAHYRSGTSPAGPLPITLGHEVAATLRPGPHGGYQDGRSRNRRRPQQRSGQPFPGIAQK